MNSKKNYGILIALSLVLIAGCAQRKPEKIEFLTFPAVGTTATRNVGEQLISHGTAKLVPRLNISKNVEIAGVNIPQGGYLFNAENSERIKFRNGPLEIYLYKDKKNICVAKEKCADVEYEIDHTLGLPVANHYQQTLLYNGKIGSKITIGYREFSGSLARTAFSNEVAYDLDESNVVGYKGARIEVIKATNTEITYKIISGFIP